MQSNLSQTLRKIWHDIYYTVTPEKAHGYALTCREAVTELNTKNKHSLRVRLHLSLCQACTNYQSYSKWLRLHFPQKKTRLPLDLSQKIFARIKEQD